MLRRVTFVLGKSNQNRFSYANLIFSEKGFRK